MSKRKRREPTETITAPQADGNKKVKTQHKPKAENTVAETSKPEQQSPLVPDGILPTSSKPRAIRIIVGSYEKVLCGIDARFPNQATERVFSLQRLC
jgi:hypothetical protein